MDERLVLMYDPFADDFGETSDRCLSDKIVTARKETQCNICGSLTKKGTRIRVSSWIFDGELHSYRYCHECCEGMEKWMNDDYDTLTNRYSLAGKEAHDAER